MNTPDRIRAEITQAQRQGREPTTVYLGLINWSELEVFANGNVGTDLKGTAPRATFAGLQIYRVDSTDHVAVL